jgi:hypothetical protein
MYDLDAIETINFEQLATATDRLLLLGARRRRAHTTPVGGVALARGSAPDIARDIDKTVIVRTQVPGKVWAVVKQALQIAFLVVLIAAVVFAAATIAGPGAASAVLLSGALGGLVSGVFAQRGARRARA